MCPSIETSLKDLVTQVHIEEGLEVGKSRITTAAQSNMPGSSQILDRLAEMTDQHRHIFEGHAQVRREMEQFRVDLLSKVSKKELETQLLLKANKQSVANALQRKSNKADLEPIQK